MKILLISGNACPGSKTGRLLQVFINLLGKSEVELESFDLSITALPIMDGQRETMQNAEVTRLQQMVKEADALLIITPEYHNAISGALKNLLDFLSHKQMYQKPVAMAATAGGGKGGINALNQLRLTLRGVNAWVIPEQVVVDPLDFVEEHALIDVAQQRVQRVATELVAFASRMKG